MTELFDTHCHIYEIVQQLTPVYDKWREDGVERNPDEVIARAQPASPTRRLQIYGRILYNCAHSGCKYRGAMVKRSRVSALSVGVLGLVGFAAFLLFGATGQAAAATANWQKSVMIQSRSSTDFSSSSFDQSVDKALADGANYIVLVVAVHQSNIYSTDVQAGNDTPTDQAITAGVNYIHTRGAHAVINIHDDPYDGQWRATINPTDRASWFASYGAQLQHYALLAQTTHTEEMVLGTELTNMTSAAYNSTNTGYWLTMIQNVRNVYGGALTYSAQHEVYSSDLQGINFWNKLDYIGISAYYSMGTDPSVAAIKAKWAQVDSSYIQTIASRWGKPVLFTEIGFASKSGTLADPGTAYQSGNGYDANLQANAYQATMDYWSNTSYFAGLAWWDWSSDPNAGGTGNTDYTPQNKPAEVIMKQYFTGTSSTTPPTPAPTTPPTTPPTTASSYTLTSTNDSAPTGAPKTLNVSVSANGNATGLIVDLELYDPSGNRVAQQVYQNQNLATTPQTFALTWTPTTAGTYSLRGGVFTANWAANLVWNNDISRLNVTTPSLPAPPAPAPQPQPVPAPIPPAPTPAPAPAPTPVSSSVTIWWPSNGQTVRGVQPFKALLEGVDPKTYTMFWQVDGGTLNQMGDSQDGGAHKEATVDLSSWNWQPSGTYTITFIAKDANGRVLGQKSTTITVAH